MGFKNEITKVKLNDINIFTSSFYFSIESKHIKFNINEK